MSTNAVALLSEARSAPSREFAMDFLRAAERAQLQDLAESSSGHAYAILGRIYAEMATNSILPQERSHFWQSALSTDALGWRSKHEVECALEAGFLTVDYVEDSFCSAQVGEKRQALITAKQLLDEALESSAGAASFEGKVLARKASVMRLAAERTTNEERRRRDLAQALRCAARARNHSPRDSDAVLQDGLCKWVLAPYQKSDTEYHQLLIEAEQDFWTSIRCGDEAFGALTLARFFRLTYRPREACDAFELYIRAERQRRRLLRNSYVYGEAVSSLLYGQYPDAIVREKTQLATSLLQEALDAGCSTARAVVALAFLRAQVGAADAAATSLKRVHADGELDWQEAIKVAQAGLSEDAGDLVSRGFALGMEDAGVWNRLGTFAHDFVGDAKLAEAIYRQGLVLDQRNAVILTNLARLLIVSDERERMDEARRLLKRAATFADRRFTWWRAVSSLATAPRQTLEARRGNPNVGAATSIATLRSVFRRIELLEDHQQRGYALEKWLDKLFALTLSDAKPSFREGIHQIDGRAYLDKGAWIYEARWSTEQAGHDDILRFAHRVQTPGTTGLFISMSGFDEGAKTAAEEGKRATRVVLMDGEELRLVVEQQVAFDEVLRRKKAALDFEARPYFKISSATVQHN